MPHRSGILRSTMFITLVASFQKILPTSRYLFTASQRNNHDHFDIQPSNTNLPWRFQLPPLHESAIGGYRMILAFWQVSVPRFASTSPAPPYQNFHLQGHGQRKLISSKRTVPSPAVSKPSSFSRIRGLIKERLLSSRTIQFPAVQGIAAQLISTKALVLSVMFI